MSARGVGFDRRPSLLFRGTSVLWVSTETQHCDLLSMVIVGQSASLTVGCGMLKRIRVVEWSLFIMCVKTLPRSIRGRGIDRFAIMIFSSSEGSTPLTSTNDELTRRLDVLLRVIIVQGQSCLLVL